MEDDPSPYDIRDRRRRKRDFGFPTGEALTRQIIDALNMEHSSSPTELMRAAIQFVHAQPGRRAGLR